MSSDNSTETIGAAKVVPLVATTVFSENELAAKNGFQDDDDDDGDLVEGNTVRLMRDARSGSNDDADHRRTPIASISGVQVDNYVQDGADGEDKLEDTQEREQQKVELMALESSAEVRAAKLAMELIVAVKDNNYDRVETLINQGANVSYRNVFGQEPIHFGAYADDIRIVKILLANGADPNSADNLGVDPLSVAMKKENTDIAKELLRFGASAVAAIRSLANVKEGVKDSCLDALITDDVLCCCPNPIRTCFRISQTLTSLSQRQEERHAFYTSLANRSRELAVHLLAGCKDMWDVRRLLAERTNVLYDALKLNQQQFISHPFCQEYLKEVWLGQYTTTYGFAKTWVILQFLAFPVLFPVYYFQYLTQTPRNIRFSKLGDYLDLCHTPFVKFAASMISFVGFLIALVLVITKPSGLVPNTAEIVLGAWITAMLLQEIREIYQTPLRVYASSLWNWLDLLNLSVYIIVICIRAVLFFDRSARTEDDDALFAANVLLSVGAMMSGLRFLNVLEAHNRLGPLQISIRQIITDLFVFLSILVVFIFSFAMAVTKIYQSTDRAFPSNQVPLDAFSSLDFSLRTMFWSIFGLIDLDVLGVDGEKGSPITNIGNVLYGAYMVMVFILLINLFIAIITNTYQRIADNSDVVWKFARARLIREYVRYPAVPTPLNLVFEPLSFFLRLFGFSIAKLRAGEGQSSSDDAEEDAQLAKLHETIVERHLSGAAKPLQETDRVGKTVDAQDIEELRTMLMALTDHVKTLESKLNSK